MSSETNNTKFQQDGANQAQRKSRPVSLSFCTQVRGKAEKKRQKVEEQFMKAAHGQRQEAAQLRREEKIRADKERLMNEDDPDKARKLEVRLDLFVPWVYCFGKGLLWAVYLTGVNISGSFCL